MKFCLRNKKNNRFLKGYKGEQPLWTSPGEMFSAALYSEEDAGSLASRLECHSFKIEVIKVPPVEISNSHKNF